MKTHLQLIEELAQKRREEIKTAVTEAQQKAQAALQVRLVLWEPVLKVIREAVAAYPGRIELRHEQNVHYNLQFCTNIEGRWSSYELSVLDPARVTKPFVLSSSLHKMGAYCTVEDVIPTVMDIIASYLARYEK